MVFYKDRKLFIKHLSHHEQVDLDVLYKSFLEEAIKDGLPTEKYMLQDLKKEEVWTDADEKEIENTKQVIERLVAGKRVIYLQSKLEEQNKFIEEEQNKYYQKKIQKDKLIGLTAETFAEKKVNEHYIIDSFFLDAKCESRYLTDIMFDDLSQTSMQDLIRAYNAEMETVSDKNIKHLAIQEFFQVYWSLGSENLYNFFGKPIAELTYFQVKLGSYGRMFKNILEKSEGIPDEVKADPDKLLDYVRIGENAKQVIQKAEKNSPDNDVVATTVFGANEKEMRSMSEGDASTTTLSAELKKNAAQGKKGLDAHDLMKLLGV